MFRNNAWALVEGPLLAFPLVDVLPNAIVFGTGRISVATMAREGLVLNVLGAIVISGVCYVMIGII